MKLRIIGVALLSAVLLPFSHACASERTSSPEKRLVFSECHSSCIKTQNDDADTVKAFGDVPFLMDSYCGCYCTRIAMRLPREAILKAGRIMAEGGTLESDLALKTEMEGHASLCLDAIFD